MRIVNCTVSYGLALLCISACISADICPSRLHRCISREACALAFPDDVNYMDACGPKYDGRCCLVIKRCAPDCGIRRPNALYRSGHLEVNGKSDKYPEETTESFGDSSSETRVTTRGKVESEQDVKHFPAFFKEQNVDETLKFSKKDEKVEFKNYPIVTEKAHNETFDYRATIKKETGPSIQNIYSNDRSVIPTVSTEGERIAVINETVEIVDERRKITTCYEVQRTVLESRNSPDPRHDFKN